jgi:proline iminopeptidase
MKTETIVHLSGVDIYVTRQGEGKAVFVLGGPWFGQYYLRQFIDELARYFQVTAYDPRGSGRSSALTQGEITLAGHLSDLEALRRSLGIEKMNLVGHSMGAHVMLLYAAEHPDTMASLVLLHPAPPFEKHLRREMRAAYGTRLTAEAKGRMEQIAASSPFRAGDTQAHEDYHRVMYSPFFRDPSLVSQVNFAFTPTTALYAKDAEEHLFPAIASMDPGGKLGQIRCPTLVVHAEHDLVPETFPRSLAERIPNAEHVLLSGLGHFAYLEAADRAMPPVVEFLERAAG